ncbi:hypothetical protein TD95_004768, partial [Thielaviopsis punctulata]
MSAVPPTEVRVSQGSDGKPEGTSQMAAPVPPRKGKVARHCKRFWWVYALVFVLAVILVPTLVILVGVPNLMQKRVNESKVTISRIAMTNPTNDSFLLSADSTISTPGSTHATIFPFEAELSLAEDGFDYPFGSITFPKNKSSKNTTTLIDQTVQITNVTALTAFNGWLLAKETVRLRIKGKPKLKISGLSRKYKMNFNKVVELKGLNSFSGLTVSNASISLSATNNFRAEASIPNPSVITLAIGNTTFVNSFNGSSLGNVYIDNLILVPGMNNYSIRATIDQAPVTTAIMSEPYCKTGVMPFTMTGSDVVYNGYNISYFRNALAAEALPVNIDVGSALSKLGLNVTCPSSSDS